MSHPHSVWLRCIDEYLTQLESVADALDGRFAELRLATLDTDVPEVQQQLTEIATSLGELETLVVRRQHLLGRDDAPGVGATIAEKMRTLGGDPHAVSMQQRIGRIGAVIGDLRCRADALFVCGFHLHEMTTDFLRTLIGDRTAEVYERGGPVTGRVPQSRGGIFSQTG